MRTTYLAFFTLLLGFSACKKGSDSTVAPTEKYMSITAASTWQLRVVDNIAATTTQLYPHLY